MCLSQAHMELVNQFHPAPDKLSPAGRKLMARNGFQVLGTSLKDPVNAVICWTRNGKFSGGTGQALRIAHAYKIPIFNLYDPKNFEITVQLVA